MSTLILRETGSIVAPGAIVKNAPLRNYELDNNFSNLSITRGLLSNLNTSNTANLVVAINEVNEIALSPSPNIGILADLTTNNKDLLVSAINEVDLTATYSNSNVGILANLNTNSKANLVSAINEFDAATFSNTGILENLNTSNTSNLVVAINETHTNVIHNKNIVLADLANTSLGASLVGYKYPDSKSIAQTLDSLLGYKVNIRNFGADPTGVSDSSSAIQSAIDAVVNAGGGVVMVPSGTFKVTRTINILNDGVWIKGSGWNSIITRSTDFGHTFKFNGDDATGTVIKNVGITDLQIRSTALTTSGAHVFCNGVTRALIKNLFLSEGFIGYNFLGLTNSIVQDLYLVFVNTYGGSMVGRKFMHIGDASGAYSSVSSGSIYITNFNLRGNIQNQNIVEYGLHISSGIGIFLSDGHLGNGNISNIHFDGSVGSQAISTIHFNNVMSDANPMYALTFIGKALNPTLISDVKFTNSAFKGGSSGQIGILANTNARAYGIEFNNCSVIQYKLSGVEIQSNNFNKIYFNDCNVMGVGKDANINSACYNFYANTKDIYINGGRAGGHDTNHNARGTQAYGIKFSTGHANVLIRNVDLTNNRLSPIDGNSNSNVTFTECITDNSTQIVPVDLTLNLPPNGDFFTVTGSSDIFNINSQSYNRIITLFFSSSLKIWNYYVFGGNIVLQTSSPSFDSSIHSSITLAWTGTHWVELSRVSKS